MLTLLEELILRRNQLTGTIPTQFGLMTALTYLTFGSNQLSGKIPTEFGKLNEFGIFVDPQKRIERHNPH
jgi:Leucine-rich repeat (LRR) protein